MFDGEECCIAGLAGQQLFLQTSVPGISMSKMADPKTERNKQSLHLRVIKFIAFLNGYCIYLAMFPNTNTQQ